MVLDNYLIPIIILLIVTVCLLININILLSRQVQNSKDIDDAIYRLIEVIKEGKS